MRYTRVCLLGIETMLGIWTDFELVAAFERFLEQFKTQKKTGLVDSLVDMNIDEDDFSDEYDFVDSDDEAQEARRIARQEAQRPKAKYMDLLQKVSNRIEDEITIDLEDLAEVCRAVSRVEPPLIFYLVRKIAYPRRHSPQTGCLHRDKHCALY